MAKENARPVVVSKGKSKPWQTAQIGAGDPVRQRSARARDREFACRVRQLGPIARLATALTLVALLSCGTAHSPPHSPPTISNLRYAPTSAFVFNGSVPVSGSVDFVAPGGDLSTFHISTSTGAQQSISVQGVAGQRSGTLIGLFAVDASQLGHFTFEVWVVDGEGLASNHLSGTFDVLLDDTANRWTTRSSGMGPALYRVAYGGGQYVVVGHTGKILTSPDSITWTSRASSTSNALRGLAWSGTQFVAVGDLGTIVASTDGVNWSPRSSGKPTATLSAVAWSGSQFVAVGDETVSAVVLTSPDGITWTQRAPGLRYWLKGIAWTGSRFVAVGNTDFFAANGPGVLLSTDGITWTAADTGLTAGHLNDVTSNGTRTVAVGDLGAITSTDYVSWQVSPPPRGRPGWDAIAWNGTRFLACDLDCVTSIDGMNWLQTQWPPGEIIFGVAWGDARWIAVGFAGAIVTSP